MATPQTSSIVAFAILGRNNAPLYLKTIGAGESLKFHFIVHTALDVFEERAAALAAMAKKNIQPSPQEKAQNYLGLLFPTEQYRVFGYVTNTNAKFVLVLNDQSNAKDPDIKQFFMKLHNAYIDAVCNPFYVADDPITSKRFERTATQLSATNL